MKIPTISMFYGILISIFFRVPAGIYTTHSCPLPGKESRAEELPGSEFNCKI
jgi:hypothetical protein